jgi:deoxyribonuclease (pyrimidine dimer)
MTRINVVPVQELSRQHLVAEYREIVRVFALARKAQYSNFERKQPTEYTLGTGHVLYFYDKLGYIKQRYTELIDEMHTRGYTCKPVCLVEASSGIREALFKTYTPTAKALEINRQRIQQRTEEASIRKLNKTR